MSKDPWMAEGFGGKHFKEAKSRQKRRGALRFWLPKGETKEILFLDEKPKFVYEHKIKYYDRKGNERWKEVTCRNGMDPGCPYCASDVPVSYTGFLTVLDLTGYTDRKKVKHTNIRKLFAMGIEDVERFERYFEKNEGLKGWVVEVFRADSKGSHAIGSDFEFVRRVDPSKDKEFFFKSKMEGGKKKPPEVFDYREVLQPRSPEEMKMLASSGSSPVDDDDDDSDGGDDDAVY